jgi:TolA-binding protein
MNGTTGFQTPPRILIPKLVLSRDTWKAKATARKAQRKALEIRVRDLEASRENHRRRAEQLQQQAEQLQQRVDQLQQQLASSRAPASTSPPLAAPKKSTDRVAATTAPACSTSP